MQMVTSNSYAYIYSRTSQMVGSPRARYEEGSYRLDGRCVAQIKGICLYMMYADAPCEKLKYARIMYCVENEWSGNQTPIVIPEAPAEPNRGTTTYINA